MSHRRVLVLLVTAVSLGTACVSPVALPVLTSPTPSVTSTPTPTATPTPSPTPTATLTPLPAARLTLGEDAIFLGDYELARKQYQQILVQASDDDTRNEAVIGIGRTLYLERNYPAAISQLTSLTQAQRDNPSLADAWYFLAVSYEAQDMYSEAANAYAQYMTLKPGLIDGYAQEWRGDALAAAGDPAGAAAAYQAALADPPPGDSAWLQISLARAYADQQLYTQAVTLYLDIYQDSSSDYVRAQVDFLLGQTYMQLGESEQAYARYLDAAINFPTSYDSYSGLVELVNAGVQVSDLNRGLVDYFAGQYGLAVDAFTRYIDAGLTEDATALYYRAMAHRAMQDTQAAIADFDQVIQKYPTDRFWSKAYDEKAYTQWAYLEQYDQAAQTLLDFANLAQGSEDAPAALYEAARTYERGGQLTRAAETWLELIDQYPSASQSYRGLFLAGISKYRLKDYAGARTIFQRALVLASEAEDIAAAYLWVGKTYQAEGNQASAQNAWQEAADRDPTGYYSGRAAELIIGREPFAILNPLDLDYDLNAERPAAEIWLRQTFSIPADTNLADLSSFESDPIYQRAEELYHLGLYTAARDEYETLRTQYLSDPVQTYRLMNHLLERNFYRQAILSSRQILDLAHLDDLSTLSAPVYFNHIRFGVYFKDLTISSAQDENFSPLYLLSVVRQESLFEPFAQSGANAMGLMQIVPATGEELTQQLNWPTNYTDDDLLRPFVAIPLGARYLARQRDLFDGSLYAALAAYNGGPGNTLIWNELAGGDPDLLLEVIRADETRTYIEQIFEFFNLYRLIYEEKP